MYNLKHRTSKVVDPNCWVVSEESQELTKKEEEKNN